MNLLKTIRNYYFYCGIEKDEYDAVKKDAYISNFKVWRVLHYLMAAVFGFLFLGSLFNSLMETNRMVYLAAFLYSVVAIVLFLKLKEDSLAAQLLIYLSISVLFLFGAFLAQNRADSNATTFIVFLLIAPMLMIDKPFFMSIELVAASIVFIVWMSGVKPHDVWLIDLANVVVFTIVGAFLNVIANSIRIREFVLTREINIQKDTDEMTGLKNKGCLTREIDEFLADDSADKGTLFILDLDRFKLINDTYGHDVGDSVISQFGHYLSSVFSEDAIVGRFGGDEFIAFIRNSNDQDTACAIADRVVSGTAEQITLPDVDQKVSVSIGIALYDGLERRYSEIFKKADAALYKAKADQEHAYFINDRSTIHA